MDGTPRLRSAFPATPQTRRRGGRFGGSPTKAPRLSGQLPEIPALQKAATSPAHEPLIPESIIDAPSQRLYAFTIWVALWTWKMYDFYHIQESEEQSLWLFMKWVALDGIWFFGLPGLRIPWLEWSSTTMTLLFSAHALVNGVMMFRIPIPIGAGFAALGKSIWGAYELAVNEHRVNPRAIEFNESVIMGRQIIHILPEGSAILNSEKHSYCIGGSRMEARLPITINSTNPISMELLRMDLETRAEETIQISKSMIKTMHKEASRLQTYSDKPNEPKTLYYTVKKPGVYSLKKVVDERNLEVTPPKPIGQTAVVPCPGVNILPAQSDRCRGEVSNIELEVTGTPPLRVKYRKMVNQQMQESTFESIQPEEFVSPLANVDHQTAITIPNTIDPAWAKPHKIRVPLIEGMGTAGRWLYSISEVQDGFRNIVEYSDLDHEDSQRYAAKLRHLHQVIVVHERPVVYLQGCTPQNPLKVARGSVAHLPVQLGSTGRGAISDSAYHIKYLFSPQNHMSANGDHSGTAQSHDIILKDSKQRAPIQDAGLYTITDVSTDFCAGEVFEPASCLLQNPPEPELSIHAEEIFDKCAGSPIGLRVDLDVIGTPPFDIQYHVTRKGDRHHTNKFVNVNGVRGQVDLTPPEAGEYTYDFVEISDAVYKARRITGKQLRQSVKPAVSASIKNAQDKRVACIDEKVSFDVAFNGEGPFRLDYEVVHLGKRTKFSELNIHDHELRLKTEELHDGGDYTIALVSVTDGMGCKEFLKSETKASVRHQKPKVGFGQIEGRRFIESLEGKKVQIPLRLAGESPWTVRYADSTGHEHAMTVTQANDKIVVQQEGTYHLIDVQDSFCPGQIDELAKDFEVSWLPRPQFRIPESDIAEQNGNTFIKADVCEGNEDAVEVLFKGAPPYHVHYTQYTKPERGAMAPKNKELRAALNVASLRLDTAQAGLYNYKFDKLQDANYDHNPKHFSPLTIQQRVNPRPSAAFVNPGKTYSYCSVESDGEEVIPVQLHGAPPFDLDIEIKHHGTGNTESSTMNIPSTSHNIRIPHSKVRLGKSAVTLRRVSDSRGCSRLLDDTQRVQVSVHDAPTITPLDGRDDLCVGDRINFALSGVAPFNVFYKFEGRDRKAVTSDTTFRRLAEKPGTFTVTGLTDSASNCHASANTTRHIHGMPSVRVSHGRETYTEIHEGGDAKILFEFGGTPPFEFWYTRSTNAEKGSKQKSTILDMRHAVSEEHSMHIRAGEEGTYEVVSIRDRHCGYTKSGVDLDWGGRQKLLQS